MGQTVSGRAAAGSSPVADLPTLAGGTRAPTTTTGAPVTTTGAPTAPQLAPGAIVPVSAPGLLKISPTCEWLSGSVRNNPAQALFWNV